MADSTTILETTPAPARTYISERGHGRDDYLDHEIAAWGRANASDLGDLRAEVGETKYAAAKSETETAERLAQAAAAATGTMLHGIDVTREGQDRLQAELSSIRVEGAEQQGRIFERIHEFEARAHATYMAKFGAIELRIVEQAGQTRVEQLEQHAKLAALILADGAKTREVLAENKADELKMLVQKLQMEAAIAAKKP